MKRLFTLALILVFGLSMSAQKNVEQNSYSSEKQLDYLAINQVAQKNLHSAKSIKTMFLSEGFESAVPPTGWANFQNGAGTNTWEQSTSNFVEGSYSAKAAWENSGGNNEQWLVTPAITLAASNNFLTFYLCDYYSSNYGSSLSVEVSTTDQTTTANFTTVQTWTEADVTNNNPSQVTVDLSAYNGQTVYIAFVMRDDDGDSWYIDDVQVFEQTPNDLATVSFSPAFIKSGEDYAPMVTINNVGSAAQDDFTIDFVVNDGTSDVFTSTLSVTGANLASNTDSTFAMPDTWSNPPTGTYTVTAIVTLTGDGDNSNDTLEGTLNVVELSYARDTLYSYDAFDVSGSGWGEHFVGLHTDGTWFDMAASTTDAFIVGGDFVGGIDGVIYGISSGSNNLYAINGDGSAYLVANINLTDYITGLTYDVTTGNTYIVAIDGSDNSILYTLDVNTATATLVGTIDGGSAMIIAIAADTLGNIYGAGLDDNLYSIDKATGAGTSIGALGIDINYGQDIGVDRTTNTLYGTLYDNGGNGGGLYTIDVTTGAATLINSVTDELSLCALYTTPVYTVTFNVVDTTGAPLENANINVDGQDITTDNAGVATIDLANGDYTAITSLTGYYNDTTDFTVADSAMTINIELMPLPPTYTITFNVVDTTGAALENANINVDGQDITTDTAGVATIDLANGDYTAITTLTGYEADTTDFTVADSAMTVDVILVPEAVTPNTLTFNVDMRPAIDSGLFDISTDTVFVTGSFIGWNEPGTNVANQMMTDADGDTIYTMTFTLDSLGHYEYKYFINSGWANGEWDGGSNRVVEVAGDTTVNDIWGILATEVIAVFNADVTISPNPTNGVLRITADDNYTVNVFDITGKVIETVQMTGNSAVIDLSSYNSGVYFVRLNNEKGFATYKVIKK